MHDQPPPTFDEWVSYCFTQGYDEFSGTSRHDAEAVEAREMNFFSMDPSLLTSFMIRLFESPSFVAERYTGYQIARATWFLFGGGSGYIHEMRSGAVPSGLQVRCVRSLTTLYTDLYDRVCGRHRTDPDSDLRESDELDGAVYAMWDLITSKE